MSIKTQKENDYIISVTQDLSSGATLTRLFNYASENVTSIYERRYTYGEGVGMTSQMTVQNFSELDSQTEVDLLRTELERQGGHPPASTRSVPKPRVTGTGGLSQ